MLKKVCVHLYSQSKPLRYENVLNCYTKDDLYCIMLNETTVHKFPVQHIFRIAEES